MLRGFSGFHSISMDAKGRMSIPAKFRDQLLAACEGKVVVTIDPDTPNLALYPIDRWGKIEAEIEALPRSPQARYIQQKIIGHASDLDMDANGRILIPPKLREHAVLEKKLNLLGQGKKIEIWSEDLWKQRFDDMQNMSYAPKDLPVEMQSLSY